MTGVALAAVFVLFAVKIVKQASVQLPWCVLPCWFVNYSGAVLPSTCY